MQETVEYVVGYDARSLSRDLAAEWPTSRRMMYLMNPEAPEPLSVDSHCWPSAMEDRNPVVDAFGCSSISEIGVQIHPDSFSCCLYLWPCLGALLHYCSSMLGMMDTVDYRLIAVTRLVDREHTLSRSYPMGGVSFIDEASVTLQGWSWLGYDVADAYGLSGLLNCGTDNRRELDNLAGQFADRLNDSHLLIHPDDAAKCASCMNVHVEEHAPFYVYGIYELKPGTYLRETIYRNGL